MDHMNKQQITARLEVLKSLRFGTELEIVGITSVKAAAAIRSVVGGEFVHGSTHLAMGGVKMADGRIWNVVRDSSLHDSTGLACEVVSPILTFADLDNLQAIVRAIRAAGGRVNESCGMHVHVDGAGFIADPSKVRNLIALAYRWENVAVNMARVLQNRAGYCRTLSPEMVDRFRRPITSIAQASFAWYGHSRGSSGHYDQSRYHWINVHALFDKGTIEFRLFNGTLHAGQVKANILFALGMASTALFLSSVSFKGQTSGSRTLADGRRAVTSYDAGLFVVRILSLSGDEFATYRKHLVKAIATDGQVAQ